MKPKNEIRALYQGRSDGPSVEFICIEVSEYRVLVGKRERKRPLRRQRLIWEDNIKMNFQEVGCGGMDWI